MEHTKCPHVMSKFATQLDCYKAREEWYREQLAAAQEELAVTKESSVTQPTQNCGRCGKHQIAGIHTCTPTAWARKMEEELAKLREDVRNLTDAGTALVNRWESPKWTHDAPHTGTMIVTLRKAIDAARKDKR